MIYSGLLDISGHTVEQGEVLSLTAKTGLDGSGSHRARHQMVNISRSLEENPHLDPESYKNYLLTCVCPLTLSSIKDDGKVTVIWKNTSPNSIAYTRPLSLIRVSESREVIESEFADILTEIMDTKMQVKYYIKLQIHLYIL